MDKEVRRCMAKNRALVFGCTGQDGSFMCELLHKKGYEVFGITKPDAPHSDTSWLRSLCPVTIYLENILDKNSVKDIIDFTEPHEIYNFAGISNVFDPYEDIDLLFNTNTRVPQYILESIVSLDKSIKFFQASSSLIFGRDGYGIQNESTVSNPIYPYGISKLAADHLIKEFRNTYGLFACSGILFNHESERRGERFFSKKIAMAVAKIKLGLQDTIKVGNLSSFRDYGYAPDFCEAAHLMLQNDKPTDYVIGTGEIITMMDFTKKCFEHVGLSYDKYVDVDSSLYRHNDTPILKADISKIVRELGWTPKHTINDIVRIMVDNETKILNDK